ncbi:hypothetical protein Megpolyxen_00263 [Candidatus Megaera polyxenophila]|nr:hypothetical protein Megpolyxen_00263 [Candidatus Megaera polyxenophila]
MIAKSDIALVPKSFFELYELMDHLTDNGMSYLKLNYKNSQTSSFSL